MTDSTTARDVAGDWPNVAIRRAGEDDARAVAELHVLTGQVAFQGLVPHELLAAATVENRTARWRERIAAADPATATFLAEVDGEPIGFAHVHRSRDEDVTPSTGEVQAVYVRPDYAGLGIGNKLMDAGLACLRDAGCDTATLYVLEANLPAQGFYRKHGWAPDGVATEDEAPDGTPIREVRFTRSLAG